jgi:S-adenosylmethionine:tRNA ribosyltransferase-isomerase
MKTSQLDYELPSELIAQHPANVRSESRLLVMERATGRLIDSQFRRLSDFLRAGDCLVFNDTKVLPARFFAHRRTGGRLEGLFLNTTATAGVWEVMLKGARKLKPDETIILEDGQQRDFCTAEVLEKRPEGVCLLKVENEADPETVLDEIGFPPLPPYIRRDHDLTLAECDRRRYQTVYARRPGAVAAPTAGLHFTDELLHQLQEAGVHLAYVTLHVGAGTFKPIATETMQEHQIHREWYRLDEDNAAAINAARAESGRIVAVGTTVTRVLETVADVQQVGWASAHADGLAADAQRQHGLKGTPNANYRVWEPRPILRPAEGTTDLFITPGYRFKVVEAMVTNFHLPRSTLLALVAAFAGLEPTLAAYRHAIEQRYRFYSYGDAMLIL